MLTAKRITLVILIAGAMVISTNAFAWNSYGHSGSNYAGDGNEWDYSGYDSAYGTSTAKVTAWSDDSNGKYLNSAELKHSDTYGYMVDNNDSSDDNNDQYQYIENHNYTDSVLFDYGDDKCVVLNEIAVTHKYENGYKKDTDVAVLAYLGSKKGQDFKDYLAGKTYDDLMGSNEWKVFEVDDIQNTTDGKKKFNETDKIAVSKWLVMANSYKDGNDDYFKIKHMGGYQYTDDGHCGKIEVKCTPHTSVPEPQTLALLGLGLLGMVATRRRKA